MPLTGRSISPVNVSLGRLPANKPVNNELECVANGTLANLMRQMSSLCNHAHQMFSEVFEDLRNYDERIERIHDRVENLQIKLDQDEPINTGVNVQNSQFCKPFKSANNIETRIFDRATMPPGIAELYAKCDDPPKLELFDQYREDHTSALKTYTDPQFFMDIWKRTMLSEDEEEPKKKTRSRPSHDPSSPTRRRRVRQTSATRQQHQPVQSNVVMGHYQAKAQKNHDEFMHFPSEYQAPQLLRHTAPSSHDNLPPPPGMSYPQPQRPLASSHHHEPPSSDIANFQGLNVSDAHDIALDDMDDDLPPPPPPLSDHTANIRGLSSPSTSSSSHIPSQISYVPAPLNLPDPIDDSASLPPPPTTAVPAPISNNIPAPPPLPPTQPVPSSPPTSASMTASVLQSSNVNTFGSQLNQAPRLHANLQDEIKQGRSLRVVMNDKAIEEENNAIKGNDVHMILLRHMAQRRQRATESSDEENDDQDDDEWE